MVEREECLLSEKIHPLTPLKYNAVVKSGTSKMEFFIFKAKENNLGFCGIHSMVPAELYVLGKPVSKVMSSCRDYLNSIGKE